MRFTDINRIPGFVAAFRPLLGQHMDGSAEKTFEKMINNWEQGKDVKGRSWEPLAPSTVAGKGHDTPLIESGDMLDSAEYKVNRKDLEVQFSIDSEYAAVHEFGAPDQGIPARPILQPAADVLAENMHPAVRESIDDAYTSAGAAGLAMSMGVGSMGNNVR